MGIRIPPKTDKDAKDTTAALQAAAGATQPASPTTAGVVKQGAAVANATDEASAVVQLNALLASLRASGAIGTTS